MYRIFQINISIISFLFSFICEKFFFLILYNNYRIVNEFYFMQYKNMTFSFGQLISIYYLFYLYSALKVIVVVNPFESPASYQFTLIIGLWLL